MKKILLLLVVTGCTAIPEQAYFNRGQPESLLTISAEEVKLDLDNLGAIRQLTDWVDRERPTEAKLTCNSEGTCDQAAEVLDQFNVPYEVVDGGRNSVELTFEQVEARDCNHSYISNHINPYNINHTSFGCATAVNQLQMVSDKTQFTDPKLLGAYDAQKAVQNFDTYLSRDAVDLDTDDFSVGGGNNNN
jgi:hypothetical protein